MKTLLCTLIAFLCYGTSLCAQAKDYVELKLELVKNVEKPSCFKATLTNKTDCDMLITVNKYCLASEVEFAGMENYCNDGQLILDSYDKYPEGIPLWIQLDPHSTCDIELPLFVSTYGLVLNRGILPSVESLTKEAKRARVYLKNIDVSLVKLPLTSEVITLYSNWVDVDGAFIAELYWQE